MTHYTDRGAKPPVDYEAFDHLKYCVGNAKQAAVFYSTRLGFQPILYKGLETGQRDKSTYVLQNGKIFIVLESTLGGAFDEIQEFLSKHGDGIKDIAFTVDSVEAAYKMAVENGAESIRSPYSESDDDGTVKFATICVYGDIHHTFVERKAYNGLFLPGYKKMSPDSTSMQLPDISIDFIDHCVSNQPVDKMTEICERYEKVLGFHRFWSVDDKDIHTEFSSLRSIVMADYTETVKMPINEPAEGKRKSQIQEYVDYHHGPGIQHVAFSTNDIITCVSKLKERGVSFLVTSKAYYDDLRVRLSKSKCKVNEDISALQKLNILVDFDDNGYLLQIFTQPVEDRPTLFYEIIQRNNHNGFGAGNFKALFESIEKEQAERGNL